MGAGITCVQEKGTRCSWAAGGAALVVSARCCSVFGVFSSLVHVVLAVPAAGARGPARLPLLFGICPGAGRLGLHGLAGELSPFSHPSPTKAPFGYLRWGIEKPSAHKSLVIDKVAICRCVCVFSREVLAAVGAGGGSAPALGEGAVLQTAVRLLAAPAAPRHSSWL